MSAMLQSLITKKPNGKEDDDKKKKVGAAPVGKAPNSPKKGGAAGAARMSVRERQSLFESPNTAAKPVKTTKLGLQIAGAVNTTNNVSKAGNKFLTALAKRKGKKAKGFEFSLLPTPDESMEMGEEDLSSHLGPVDEMSASASGRLQSPRMRNSTGTLRGSGSFGGTKPAPRTKRLSLAVQSRQQELHQKFTAPVFEESFSNHSEEFAAIAEEGEEGRVTTRIKDMNDSFSGHADDSAELTVAKKRISKGVQRNAFVAEDEGSSNHGVDTDDPFGSIKRVSGGRKKMGVAKKRLSTAVLANAFHTGDSAVSKKRFSGRIKRENSLSKIRVRELATTKVSIQEKMQIERKEAEERKRSSISRIIRPTKKNRRAGVFSNGVKINIPEPVEEPPPPTLPCVVEKEDLTHTTDDFTSGRKTEKFSDVYEMGKKLGEGAFGEVFVCIHKETKQERAVKVLNKDQMSEWEYDEVLAEFQLLTKMDNPNVIRVYEFYDNKETFYMVQELAQGGELFDELEKHGKLKEKDVALLMKNILACTKYLAEKRIVHRDVNLENILLEEAGNYNTVKLIDFGLAKECPEGEKLYELVGKARYLAPEVLGDDGYDLGYDVWSCGIIAAILLTGYFPFDSDNDMDVYNEIVDGAYINYDGVDWEGISDKAISFVKDLLAFKEEDRPTAEEALKHPWITGSTDNSVEPKGEVWIAPPVEQKKVEKAKPNPPPAKVVVPKVVPEPTPGPQDFASGRTDEKFDDVYSLGRRLGEGAFGEVFVCTHKKLKVERAVKIIDKSQMTEYEYDDVIKEFQMLTQIDNPNVIRVYEFYDTDDTFYIVQELAQGGELYDELEKHGKLKEKDVALLMKNILACTDYLAQNHICHRDINLENVLLEEPGNYEKVKLIDFGLAAKCEDGQKLFELVGKARYLAPEVLGDDGYDLAYDVWSCGVLAAVLITGYFPFDSDSDMDVYNQIVEGAYINYDGKDWTGVSAQAKSFIKKLLAFKAEDRPTAGEALKHPWITGNTDDKEPTGEVWTASTMEPLKGPEIKELVKPTTPKIIEEEETLDVIMPSLAEEATGSAKDFVSGRTDEKFEDVYTLGKRLGEGAFGEVFVCTHKQLKVERAVKVIDKNQMSEWEYDDVIKEFQMLTKMDNPNVIRVYEFYDTDDTFYIVQELAQGGELFDELDRRGKFPEKDVALLMKHILGCTKYLADQRIVHRDINLENVLLEEPGNYNTVKLIDFGLAANCEEGQKLYELVGKARYLAPEVLGDDGYDLAYDVWSCGVLTAVLLTGYFPFDSDSDMDVYSQITEGAYINYNGLDWQGISGPAKQFVRQLLTFDGSKRPTAAEALKHPWITGNTDDSEPTGEVWCAATPAIEPEEAATVRRPGGATEARPREEEVPDITMPPLVKEATGKADDFVSGRTDEKFEDIYKLGKRLGEGAFGEVFVCTHKKLKVERAVKVIDKNQMSEWEYDDVIKEFQMLTKMDNPNVIRVYEFYDTDDTFYIVQELAQGGELFDELDRRGKFPEKDVALLMKHILGCTKYVADQRIVHRDINLENVLLEAPGNYNTVKLIDFGLAANCEEGQKLYELVGKARYLAPEVLGDDGYDLAYDVWSCGVLTAVLLTGYFPFDSDSDMDVYSQITEGAYINYDGLDWQGISGQAKSFVKKLLTFEDSKRPTAAEALKHPWITGNTDSSKPNGEVWCSAAPANPPEEAAPVRRPGGATEARPREEKKEEEKPDITMPSLAKEATGSAKDFVSGRTDEKFEDVYTLGKMLGEGAFGEVYVCTHKKLKVERAVKVIDKNPMSEWEYDDVIKEFQIMTKMDNPNVIRVYEFYDTKDTFYIVQELAQGGELFDELDRRGKFPEKDAALLMKHVLGCTKYLAGERIVHRDVNLENILLEAPGNYNTVKLIDFGLADKVEEGQKLFDFVGKARYVAPEVLGHDGYGLGYDVWSVGVLTVVLLTGYFPFDDDSDVEVFRQISEGAYIDYDGEDWKGISGQAKRFVKKLLTYDDDKRPTAAEMLKHPWIKGNTDSSEPNGEVWCSATPAKKPEEPAPVRRPGGASEARERKPKPAISKSDPKVRAARIIQKFMKYASPFMKMYNREAAFWRLNLSEVDRQKQQEFEEIKRMVEFEKQQLRLEMELKYHGDDYKASVRQMAKSNLQMVAVKKGELRIVKQKYLKEKKEIPRLRWENRRLAMGQPLQSGSFHKVNQKIKSLQSSRHKWMAAVGCLRVAKSELRRCVLEAKQKGKGMGDSSESDDSSSSSSSSGSSSSSDSSNDSFGTDMTDEKKDAGRRKSRKSSMSKSSRSSDSDMSYSWKEHRKSMQQMDASAPAAMSSTRRSTADKSPKRGSGKKKRLSIAADGSLLRLDESSHHSKKKPAKKGLGDMLEKGRPKLERRNSIGSTDMDKEMKEKSKRKGRKKKADDAVPGLVEMDGSLARLVQDKDGEDAPFSWQDHSKKFPKNGRRASLK